MNETMLKNYFLFTKNTNILPVFTAKGTHSNKPLTTHMLLPSCLVHECGNGILKSPDLLYIHYDIFLPIFF